MCDTLFRQTNATHFCIDISVQLDQGNVIPITIVLGVFVLALDLVEGLALSEISGIVINIDLRFPDSTEQGEKLYLEKINVFSHSGTH